MSKIDDSLTSWYSEIDWKSLERSDLGTGKIDEARVSLKQIRSIFDLFLAINKSRLSHALAQRVEQKLNSFKSLVEQIYTYSDIRQRNDIVTLVANFEYDLVSDLGTHITYWQNLSNESSLQDFDFDTFKKEIKNEVVQQLSLDENQINITKELINLASQNGEVLTKAVEGAKLWLTANNDVVDTIIKTSANDAKKKALEHKTLRVSMVNNFITTKVPIISHLVSFTCWLIPSLNFIKKFPIVTGVIWWLFCSFIFGGLVLAIIGYFVIYVEDPTVPEIIMKLSSVIVPSYFAIFCSNQYMNHRRLYENYMFKDVALSTMISLRGQYKEESKANEVILEKSLGVIFSEPLMTVGEMKVDRTLLKDVVELMKK